MCNVDGGWWIVDGLFEIALGQTWSLIAVLLVGFVLLVKGADWLVDGASAIAKRYNVSDLVIGLTIVAFGTSLPEFVVNMISVSTGSTDLAITNVLGSNTINIFVILGCAALIYPISSQASCRRFDMPWNVLAGLLVIFFATYTRPMYINWGSFGSFSTIGGFITGIGGVVLLICFAIFMWHNIKTATLKNRYTEGSAAPEGLQTAPAEGLMSVRRAIGLIIGGLVGLVVGGEFIVRSATRIAVNAGVSEAIIGLTVVALGTSLPELATSCIAAAKKNVDIALGNVVGSNIFNIFFILGSSAVIHYLPAYNGLWIDAAMVVLGSILIWAMVAGKKHRIERWHGAVLLLIYALYLTYRLLSL